MSVAQGTISTVSFSRASIFQQCKFRAFLQYVEKIAEPIRPLPAGKTEHANDRGTRLHDNGEQYVRGQIDTLAPEWKHFVHEMAKMRRLFASGNVSLEGEWGLDGDWNTTAWKGIVTWLRLKLDSIVFINKTEAVVIDYKSGRRYGNELKHHDQVLLYQLCAFLRYPDLETVHTELWYIDQNELITQTFRRDQGLRFKQKFDKQFKEITNCADFPPNPNKYSCQYCPYTTGTGGTGHCTKGIPNNIYDPDR